MDFKKTMRMPKEMLRKWLAALRSGEFSQCQGKLEKDGSYCCLGVLQKVVDGDVERHISHNPGRAGASFGTPTSEWCTNKGIMFENEGELDRWSLPSVKDTIGRSVTAWQANDNVGLSFPQIADAIEKHAEGY
jgi:hypothetical protein